MSLLRFGRLFGLLLLVVVFSGQVKAAESNDYILEGATISPIFTADSDSNSVSGSIGALQQGQSSSNNQQQAGSLFKAVLPTPPAPDLEKLSGSTGLRAKINIGNNDQAVQVQMLVIKDGVDEGIYVLPSGTQTTSVNSWVSYQSWGADWHNLTGFSSGSYQVAIRVKLDNFTLSEFSQLSNGVTIGGSGDGSDDGDGNDGDDETDSNGESQPSESPILDALGLSGSSGINLTTPTAKNVLTTVATALIPVTALALAAQAGSLVIALWQVMANLLGQLAAWLVSLAHLLAFTGRKRVFGQIINGRDKKPVQGATVSLLRPDTRRLLDSQVTDEHGRYYFIEDNRSTYLLTVQKEGFEYFERVLQRRVNRRIVLGISLELNDHLLRQRLQRERLVNFISIFRLPLLLAGTLSWLLLYWQEQSRLITALGVYYLLAWILEFYVRRQPRPYGLVLDEVTGKPIGLVVIRVFDAYHKLQSTIIADELGRFKTLLKPGVYTFTFSKANYQSRSMTKTIIGRNINTLKTDIKLQPVVQG